MTALKVTEAQFQAQVIDLATLLGWSHLHIRRSRGRRDGQEAWQTTTNIKGWPDIFAWHPRHRFAALELKAGRNKPTPEQLQVLAELEAAGARTLVAWPENLPEVRALFEGRDR